ncbi:MAG TPA: hypothetical protein VJ951_09340, partial [Bacteroidales bacterium]|nr:hypothetical protein [Bacteroidales bacterium]
MGTFAILDFGTNTFNLLIAKKSESGFETLYSGKEAVKLGKGGINNQFITDEAMARGMQAIGRHMQTIEKYGADSIRAYATSAFRNARNGQAFANNIEKQFGFATQIIDGKEEAELIYKGIRASVYIGAENVMILDIGGGSNEFIICNNEGILWKHSYDLGMARIIEKFTISDPIKKEEIVLLEEYFESELA